MSEVDVVRDQVEQLLTQFPPETTSDHEFWQAQFDMGLAWVGFPEGRGGLGVSPGHQALVHRRVEAAGGSLDNIRRNVLGYGMGAPTLIAHGSADQQIRWLRPLFTSEEVWCQLFSEPGAGSDVAGLAATAVRDGDEWVVNGQKVWTTLAHTSRWGMLIARTDPEVPKHNGITYFIVDMHQPGVEVRPLRQITGESEFNEVYLTDARIPDRYRIGDIGDGWRIALTTLMNERVAIGSTSVPRGGGPIGRAVEQWRQTKLTNPSQRDQLMKLWVEAEALRLTNLRANQARSRGTPGPEGSTAKLQWAELNKDISAFTVGLMGAEGMLYPDSYVDVVPQMSGRIMSQQRAFLRTRANSIEGGTSEIMKNILAERVLGLPGGPRADKDQPWSEIPRS